MEVVITGGTGFLGRHLISRLRGIEDIHIRTLVRSDKDLSPDSKLKNVVGDLERLKDLQQLVTTGSTVVHLAYIPDASPQVNQTVARNIAQVCRSRVISRFVLVSTAVVAGNCRTNIVTEDTPPQPANAYERTKLEIEQIICEIARGQFGLLILRPTAIVGRGGKNLLKLATDLQYGSRTVNYLRSCLYNRRAMNLVPVDLVVSTLQAGIFSSHSFNGDIVQISCDSDPMNNFRAIEKGLMERLQIRDYRMPRIPMPGWILETLARISGRNSVHPNRIYKADKLGWLGVADNPDFGKVLDGFTESLLVSGKFTAKTVT